MLLWGETCSILNSILSFVLMISLVMYRFLPTVTLHILGKRGNKLYHNRLWHSIKIICASGKLRETLVKETYSTSPRFCKGKVMCVRSSSGLLVVESSVAEYLQQSLWPHSTYLCSPPPLCWKVWQLLAPTTCLNTPQRPIGFDSFFNWKVLWAPSALLPKWQ